MKILVLGAGVTGVTTAYFLNKAGHDVEIIDRQPDVSQETSFANGCQISVSHAEPWANPAAVMKILKWIGREDAPLLYKFKNDPKQWAWCLKFLYECTPWRTARNIRDIVRLCEYSRVTLGEIRKEHNIQYDHLVKGILHFYTSQKEYEDSLSAAALMRKLGVPRKSITGSEVVNYEPTLYNVSGMIMGGDYTESDESGDVYKFTSSLADVIDDAGVVFSMNTTVTRLITTDHKVVGVEVINSRGDHQTIKADAVVVCMGSYSAELVRPLGINLMIYPGKGYSATYQIIDPSKAPTVSLTDDEYKLVFSRLGDRLRVAGTCELSGYSRDLNPVRCEAITRRTEELFPEACDYSRPKYWTGLRPLTPSNVPYVGRTKVDGVFLNTGHGTLGWTMGCGSGRAISDIITRGYADIKLRST